MSGDLDLAGREWRERMGIEPTGGLSPGRPPVLKTGAKTYRRHF
jgi:hypothetical protein